MDLLKEYKDTNFFKLEDLYKAYFDCRRNKRNTINARKYEINYEKNLYKLYEELNNHTYKVGKSIAFIVKRPKYREVFAANFRDRIIHHLFINYIKNTLLNLYIDNSFSCTEGKGTLYGVKTLKKMMDTSDNDKDWICKMDIQSFFMNIDKDILYKFLIKVIDKTKYSTQFKEELNWLGEIIIYNRPELNCYIKGNKKDWNNINPSKSLFNLNGKKGLPIGNITSQYFANLYMTLFDKYVYILGFKKYIRYVDDFIIIDEKEKILNNIDNLKQFIKDTLHLTLHPDKFYIQPLYNGVSFIGTYIKPNKYIRIRKDTLYNIKERLIRNHNRETLMSYYGLMVHYNTYKLRKEILYIYEA